MPRGHARRSVPDPHSLIPRVGHAARGRPVIVAAERSYLAFDPAAGGAMDDLLGHSITYRVAVGPRAGDRKGSRYQPCRGERRGQGGVSAVRGVLAACRHRDQSGSARETRAVRPLRASPAGVGGAAHGDGAGAGAVSAQDAVSRRHDAHRAGPPGLRFECGRSIRAVCADLAAHANCGSKSKWVGFGQLDATDSVLRR
jgi:hypothetical protein